MSFSKINKPDSILKAVAEYDRLGQKQFLSKYGFGKARNYFLEHNNKLYASKAIVGVAYGKEFPREGPLMASQFSGGEKTVMKKLEELGFYVKVL